MPASETTNPALETPRASVVTPVYNAAGFLAASVGSVLAQSIGDWELILVDDGSADDSLAVCKEYARTDPRIRVVAQANRGPAAARNAGVNAARGDSIFDAEPFRGETKVLADGELLDYVRHFLHYPSNHLVSYCWARLYRRSLIVEHSLCADEDMRLFEDFAFNLAFLGKAKRLVFVNRPVYIYILRSGHASASMALLNAASLAADMQSFRQTIDAFMAEIGVANELAATVRREVGHTLVHYAIIFVVRTCRQLDSQNRAAILRELRRFVSSPVLRESLPLYTPRPGNSRLLPRLMKLKLVRLLAVMAQAKGNRRYGKPKNSKA